MYAGITIIHIKTTKGGDRQRFKRTRLQQNFNKGKLRKSSADKS